MSAFLRKMSEEWSYDNGESMTTASQDRQERESQNLRAENERLQQLLALLSQVGQQVSSSLHLPTVLQNIVESACKLTKARYGALGIFDEEGRIREFITHGISSEERERIGRLPQGLGILGLLQDQQRPLRLADLTQHARSVGFPEHHPPMKTFMGAPVRLGDEVLGNLYLTEREGGEEFSPEDESLLVLFAAQAALAIRNAHLYEREAEARRIAEQTQRALASSEASFRRLAEQSPDLIYRVRRKPNRAMEYVSPAALSLSGYTPEEFYADPDLILTLTHPDDRALAQFFITDHPEAPGPFVVRWVRKDGHVIWTERHRVPIYDENGEVVAVEGVVRDITQRMEAEEELERLRRDFLGMVSHELKTPLTAIKGAAAMVLGSSLPTDPQDTRELFEIINEQADKLRDLLDSVLDITRIEAGAFSVHTEPGDLQELLAGVRTVFSQSGPSRIQLEFQGVLPPVQMDKRRIEQVLTNLVGNAVKFSPPGSPIIITAQQDDDSVVVQVKDQGMGIAADKLLKLFQKFSRVHDEEDRGIAGTGLGLAICKGIIDAHGGRVWAESPGEGAGSVFTFTLPIASKAPALASPSVLHRGEHLGRVRRSGERTKVLAVDDDVQIRRLLQRSLEAGGYHPITTGEPEQTVTLVEQEEPDLVLLDMMLPGMSGLEVLKRIREFTGVPVIFLTGRDSQEDIVQALQLGADDYVTKPFSPQELLARIEAVLRRRVLSDTIEARPPFKLDALSVNFAERSVTLKGARVSLSATEYKILYELATNAGKVLTYDHLLHQVWGPEYSGESGLVRSFIRDLRRKLHDDAQNPSYILTERGVGYRMPKPA